MLVALQIKGKWNGKAYVFQAPSIRKIYKGEVAYAFGGGGGGTTEKFTPTGPWNQQVPYIQGLFGEASRLYNQGAPQYYQGSTVADTNQNLAQSQQQTQQASQGAAGQLQGAMGQTMQNAQNPTMAGQVGQGQINPYNQAINGLLQSSMGNPTQSVAQSALPAFYGGLGQASQGAATVNTPQSQFGQVNAAPALMQSMYSNGMNPFTDQIVQGALRGQNQQFSQNVLPQISSAANMSGQLGGTRQGIAEGMAAQQHQNMQKDMMAQMYGQAFDVGSQERLAALGMAGQGQQGNAQNSLAAQQLMEQQRQATMQSGLGQAGLVGNMLGQGQGLGQQGMAQAGQLSGNMIQQGSAQNLQGQVQNTALLPGLNQALNQSLGINNQVGLQQQAQDQAQRDAAVERWFYEQNAPMNMLSQYQNWISGPYGASQSGANTPQGMPIGPNQQPIQQYQYPTNPFMGFGR